MEIKVDPANMTQAQREAVAGFILAYPSKECAGTCGKHEHAPTVTPTAGEFSIDDVRSTVTAHEMRNLRAHGVGVVISDIPQMSPALDPAFDSLAQDDPAFDAAQAFGSAVAPLPLGAVAPSTAAAAPLPTAPVATLATTSTTAPSVPVPPAPPAHSQAAPTASGAALTNPVDLDKNGLPWDYRIHAESKAKIADGTWRKKRGVGLDMVGIVEDELRQLMGVPAGPAGVAPSAPLPPAAPLVAPATIPTAGPASLVAPVIVPPTNGAPLPPSAPGAASSTPAAPSAAVEPKMQFVQLIGRTSAAIQYGKVTKEEVGACCVAHGVAALPLLASRLDLVPAVAAAIDALIGSK